MVYLRYIRIESASGVEHKVGRLALAIIDDF